MQALQAQKREKKEQLRQLEEELAQLEKDMAALKGKDLAVRDAWWMNLYHNQDWETLAKEMQQAGQEDVEGDPWLEDQREWENPDLVEDLIKEEMVYVTSRIHQREEERKQARSA